MDRSLVQSRIRAAFLLIVLLAPSCGEDIDFAISSHDFDDFEECSDPCRDLCRSCHSFSSDILDCQDFCTPRCRSAGCDLFEFSFECDGIFQEACLLQTW